jgi:predicted 3-demethylubiquinone-9 3-methyltransferase (glyoxalase superfamily)
MTSITPFLWFDNNVPEAVAFYKSVFPNAKVETVNDFMATFELEGQRFNALNGGPRYKFNEAVSFFISVENQEEVDYFWNKLIADGGEESKCGWLKDKFGLSWQVVPTALGRYLSDPDRKKADRAMQAMMKMQKIVIADLDKAYAGFRGVKLAAIRIWLRDYESMPGAPAMPALRNGAVRADVPRRSRASERSGA